MTAERDNQTRTREGADPQCRYYEWGTWDATQHLRNLRAEKVSLSAEDVRVLFEVFEEGCADADSVPTLVEFGKWLSASEEFQGLDPAEVVW